MSSSMLLINPRRRRKAPAKRKTTARRRVRRATTVTVRANPVRRRRRRSNPISTVRRRVMRRSSNPVAVRRRRRNPIGLSSGSLMAILKSAAVGGAGAIAVDLAMGQVAKYLPASMARTPGKVGLYDVAKIGVTVLLGKFLSKPTRGLSQKMAQGSLTVQAHQLLSQFVPTGTMPLGYYSPAAVSRLSQRIGPNGVGAYTRPGATPLLNQYVRPGASPLLNGGATARKEGVRYR